MEIKTVAVKKEGDCIGWEVYINNSKFPKKPFFYYRNMSEGDAVMEALLAFKVELEEKKKE